MKISNVGVDHQSEHSDYSLSWETTEGRFHVWLTPDDSILEGYRVSRSVGRKYPTIYKNSLFKRGEEGHFETRYLDQTRAKNKAVFDQAMAEALAGGLFLKADAALLEAEQKRLAKAAAAHKIELAEKAGPKMLALLRLISDFWRENDQKPPMAEAVREAIWFAETGGAVKLCKIAASGNWHFG